MNKQNILKRGTFTVEAAVIVPMTVIMTALLIGYCYYAHQINWFKGAAYEAAEAGLKDPDKQSEKAEARINDRTAWIPLNVGSVKTEVSSGTKLAVSFEGNVLDDVFGSLFRYRGEAALRRFDPAKVKMLEFFLERIGQ